MLRLAIIFIVLLLTCPVVAWADSGAPWKPAVVPDVLWRAWNYDSLILLNLSLLGLLYLRGIRRLWRKAGTRRGVTRPRAAAFLGSLGVLFVALISPLHALSEELASAHMVQHMLLMVVAAPLFVLGSPGLVCTWGLPTDWRPIIARWRRWQDADALGRPAAPWVLYAVTLWIWHFPVAYEAAMVDPFVHDAQHLSFFGAACLFWRSLLDPLHRLQLHPLAAVVALFTTSLHAMLLGVFMALSPVIWYETYTSRTVVWGLTPLEDQQLAGLIMWMPACLVYPAAAAAVFGTWLTNRSVIERRRGRHPMQGA
jgi:putative membrane protein